MAIATSNSVTTPVVNSSNGTLEDEFINGLVQGGSWVFSGPRDLTYAFNLNDDGTGTNTPEPGNTWTVNFSTAVTQALTAWSNVANINFQLVTSGTLYYESSADLTFTLTGDDLQSIPELSGAVALGVFPSPVFADTLFDQGEYPDAEGDIFFDNYHSVFSLINEGGTGLTVMLHEIGHALGLKHPFDNGENAKPTFADLSVASFDSLKYTVMSGELTAASMAVHGFPSTPMPLDILAIQHIYGVNTSYRTGDDVYVFENDGKVRTFWDAGGADTFNFANLFTDNVIDLREGGFSYYGTILGPLGNLGAAIAFGTIIENATGGSGSDTLFGNGYSNFIDGGSGLDCMIGGGGNDVYVISDAGDLILENASLSIGRVVSVLSDSDGGVRGAVSEGGRVLAFSTGFSGLIEGDTTIRDVFVKDTQTGLFEKISTGVGGAIANGASQYASVSTDGRYLAFESSASNLVTGDTNGTSDIFLKDRLTGELVRISTDDTGNQGNGSSTNATISGDGRFAVFESNSNNLGSSFLALGVYVKNLQTGDISGIVTGITNTFADSRTKSPDISADGRYLVFESFSGDLVSGDTNVDYDIFVRDLQMGTVARVSTGAAGEQGNAASKAPKISGNGRYVVFESAANNLVATDNNASVDVFRKDILTGAIDRVTVREDGIDLIGFRADISDDGRYVTFISSSPELPGSSLGAANVYRKDMLTDRIERISVGPDGDETQLAGGTVAAISPDGGSVVFIGSSAVLPGGDGSGYIYFSQDDASGEGIDTARSSSNYVLPQNVENLQIFSTEGRSVSGNFVQNIIAGSSGHDTLDGAAGADIIAGGAGNDTYVVDNSGDQVMELGNSGIDLIQSAVTYSLMQAWHVENLTLTGVSAINGFGNWMNNVIIGNAASNLLEGERGNDTISGGGGSDTLIGGLGDDVLVWDALDAKVNGGDGFDRLLIDGNGVTLDLTAISNALITDVEYIDITGSGNNTLTLTLADVLAISSSTDILTIDGNAGDLVQLQGAWTNTGGSGYTAYVQGSGTVLIDTDITVDFI